MGNSPKRRKYRDNPYVINYNESNNTYIVVFNFNSKEEKVNVSKEVYDVFNQYELMDIKQMNERDRHYEHIELTDEDIYRNSVLKNETVDDIVENKILKEELKKAIECLSEKQRRRIKMYFFEDLKLKRIAEIEGCSIKNVYKSIEQAIQILKKNIKK